MHRSLIPFEELPAVRARHRGERISFVTGVFDITHPGHVHFLRSAKAFGDILVVGVGNDAQVGKLKPGRPIWPERWRAALVSELKPVDYCFIGPPETVRHPLAIVEMAFSALAPDVYVIRGDAFDIPHRQSLAERYNVQLAIAPERSSEEFETDEVTTTRIIERLRTHMLT